MAIKKVSKKVPTPANTEVIKGVPDTTEVVKPSATIKVGEPMRRVGMSKGMTLNMGDYQSARVDLWMERVVADDERAVEKAIIEMSDSIDGYLEEEIADLRKK